MQKKKNQKKQGQVSLFETGSLPNTGSKPEWISFLVPSDMAPRVKSQMYALKAIFRVTRPELYAKALEALVDSLNPSQKATFKVLAQGVEA